MEIFCFDFTISLKYLLNALGHITWQWVVLILVILFKSQIKILLESLVDLTGRVKKIGGLELSEEAKESIEKTQDESINKEINEYETITENRDDIAFVSNFIEFEKIVNRVFTLVDGNNLIGNNYSSRSIRNLESKLRVLIDNQYIKKDVYYRYQDVRRLRNAIVHGASRNNMYTNDMESFLKLIILLKDDMKKVQYSIMNKSRNSITEALSTLTPREERVIRMRYGIGMKDPLSVADTANRFNVTESSIISTEKKAIEKLYSKSRGLISEDLEKAGIFREGIKND